MNRIRTIHIAKWITLVASLCLALAWCATMWRGLYYRNGLYTMKCSNSGLTIWKASAANVKYAKVNETYFFPAPAADLQSLIPRVTTSPPIYDWIARLPYWLPLVLLTPATIALWRRDRRIHQLGLCPNCNYNRSTLPTASKCPECGTV